MTSPGGPARASGPVPGAAGTDSSSDGDTAAPAVADTLRPVPDGPVGTDDTDGTEGSEPADGADGAAPEPTRASGSAPDLVPPGGDGDGSWPGAGPDTGTVRRSRPSRSPRAGVGVPTPPSPMNAATGPTAGLLTSAPPDGAADPAAGGAPSGAPEPPRRPVPPTFPSAGQPPPGVARRHGRHARPERVGAAVHTPPSGYRPRHAAPDAETEQFAATPVTGPGGIGPMPLTAGAEDGRAGAGGASVPDLHGTTSTALHTGPGVVVPPLADTAQGQSDRVRVVLAERRVPTRAVRTVAEIEQQTETGELLLRNLLRAQLALGLRLGLVAVFVLGALPVLFLVLPRAGTVEIAGVTLPWLVLGVLPYPFMLALAWLYTRTAESNELDFADNVED
ncbi:hypothetical protein Acsp06_26860 [Actinomycetospora sp. NBRC 106375]|uniref:hypothetical protein n=1 Tax=Actinomycetospora sp. NBRC 106375 TaxID=3032207 RepID=UPI0024A1D689|nr:hypothetical protein [Actinomycetospora sp. NBRC 106375]GLZ46501.1 hypothetical protein Acsp06_26860 [Actinomycetospora sp. NBRC 106375]